MNFRDIDECKIYYNDDSKDLYFVGIKKGNYNFNSLEKYISNGVINTSHTI
jgi:hypothetical protein